MRVKNEYRKRSPRYQDVRGIIEWERKIANWLGMKTEGMGIAVKKG